MSKCPFLCLMSLKLTYNSSLACSLQYYNINILVLDSVD
jgi:hypothetical protein